MRSETEMLNLIRSTAENDSRIRAAWLEGSRVNPSAPRDLFQDYDVVYVVTETRSFREDRQWIDRFGERLYMQYPEENPSYPSDGGRCYGWLIQFADGNRLDLHVCTWDYARDHLELYTVLVDKDNLLPQKQMCSDRIYWVKKPSQEQFSCACNEFWWCLNNAAKGLWRGELPYAMEMIDFNIRPMLRQLLEWKIGVLTGFSVSAGKSAKYMDRYLPPEDCRQYLQTYSAAETEAVWEAVFTMCGLFDRIAGEVGSALHFTCDRTEAENSRMYLEHVRKLPRDAEQIY